MSSSEPDVAEFVAAAREFCEWAESDPADDETERFTALVLLSNLYARALRLPQVDMESFPSFPLESMEERPDQFDSVMTRLGKFPGREYWWLEESRNENAERVADDLGRDLYMTYTAVRPALDDFDSGADLRGRAIWTWSYTFWADWGRHSTHAIQVLHEHFHEKAWSDEGES